MKKEMVAYLFKERLILSSRAVTKSGLRIEVEPCREIDSSRSSIEIGDEILQIFGNYQVGIQNPTGYDAPILKYLAIKSYRTLMKSAKLVFLEWENGHISFIPSESDKKYGYVRMTDWVVKVEESLVEEFYRGLMEAFSLCKWKS